MWPGSLKRMSHVECEDALMAQVPTYVVVFVIASNTNGQSRFMSSNSTDSISTTSWPIIPSKLLSPGFSAFHALGTLSIVQINCPSATETSFPSSLAVEFDPRCASRRIRRNALPLHRLRNRASP